jgi:vesicle-fusing ATPase
VHYDWGTARAWRSAGISALFYGASGTGKTMAAECLARALELPLYRVDLSQLVDKYVGETEKNLKRVFDAAERADLVLFLDEAESIFGRRMETRSAQDRWANLEISYLLTRMENARGLTILATNRKDDFDAAFMRRLRYVVQFPLPDVDARLQIWRQCLPTGIDTSAVDVEFLAHKFSLTGGQIRSIVFNACLQSAGGGRRALVMEPLIVAVWRELQKQEGAGASSQFGAYADVVRAVEATR